MVEITKHHTVTVFVVFNNKVLLINHKKHKIWLPPGGHIERDEIITDTALKEVKEETGLDIELYNDSELINYLPKVKGLTKPMAVLLENINEHHQHIDFIYFAEAFTDKINPGYEESNELRWFSIEDLEKEDIQKDIKELGIKAINAINIKT